MYSVALGSLGEDLSALEPVELLLVEVGEPVVVYLPCISDCAHAQSVAKSVAYEGGGAEEGPLGGAQLGVLQVGKELGSRGE